MSQNVVTILILFLLFCGRFCQQKSCQCVFREYSVYIQHSLQVFRQWANDGVYKSVQFVQNAVLYLQLLSPSFNLKDTLPVLNCNTTCTSVFNQKVLLQSLLKWKKYRISTVEVKSKKMWQKRSLNRKCCERFKEKVWTVSIRWNMLESLILPADTLLNCVDQTELMFSSQCQIKPNSRKPDSLTSFSLSFRTRSTISTSDLSLVQTSRSCRGHHIRLSRYLQSNPDICSLFRTFTV